MMMQSEVVQLMDAALETGDLVVLLSRKSHAAQAGASGARTYELSYSKTPLIFISSYKKYDSWQRNINVRYIFVDDAGRLKELVAWVAVEIIQRVRDCRG